MEWAEGTSEFWNGYLIYSWIKYGHQKIEQPELGWGLKYCRPFLSPSPYCTKGCKKALFSVPSHIFQMQLCFPPPALWLLTENGISHLTVAQSYIINRVILPYLFQLKGNIILFWGVGGRKHHQLHIIAYHLWTENDNDKFAAVISFPDMGWINVHQQCLLFLLEYSDMPSGTSCKCPA